VLATKYEPRPDGQPNVPGSLRARILEGVDLSLRRLRTDRIDLYYQHYADPEAPLEEARKEVVSLAQELPVAEGYGVEQLFGQHHRLPTLTPRRSCRPYEAT